MDQLKDVTRRPDGRQEDKKRVQSRNSQTSNEESFVQLVEAFVDFKRQQNRKKGN